MDEFKRVFTGKPPQSSQGEPYGVGENEPAPEIRKHVIGTFPIVRVRRVVTRINDDDMDIDCEIANESDMRVYVDRIRFLGRDVRLGHDLAPGQSREFTIYRGPLLKYKGDERAVLQFRTAEGRDYFEARHIVGFQHQPGSDAYTVDSMRFTPPVRDIYG
jgi:hypothetical protein